MNLWYWLRRPHRIPAQLRYRAWVRRNPDKPWLTPGAVEFCEAVLRPDMVGVEFGSGRSTAWFAGRLARLTSVEHNPEWFARVKGGLELAGVHNVDYRFVPPEPAGAPADHPRYAAVLGEFPDDSLDLVVIDGHYRDACLALAPPKLKPGGLLLVDDVGYWPGNLPPGIPADWPLAHDSTNGIKSTRLWRKPG
jgi:hypothetical protein